MDFVGVSLERFFQYANPGVEIGLAFHLPVYGGDESRELLSFLFFQVKLQRLKKGVIWILRHPCVAQLQSVVEIAVGPMLAHFRIGIVQGIMFGAHLIVKILIAGSFRAGGIRSPPVQFQYQRQLGQGVADFSLLPGVHGSMMQLLFFLT